MDNQHEFDWKKYIIQCMSSTDYCCIATAGDSGVWANPVFFAWDENMNLYFVSQMHTRHMKNLVKYNRIAVAIYPTTQKGDLIGIQLEGYAFIVQNDQDSIRKAFGVYFGRAGKGPDVADYIAKNPSWAIVRIEPKDIYYFDTRFFGEECQAVPFDPGTGILSSR